MAWPNDNGTIPSNMSGTTLLADGSDDHSLMHREAGTILNALPTTFGSTSGTNLLRGISAASDQILTANSGGTASQTISKGTFNNILANNITIGTPTINVWNGWVQANEVGTMLGTLSANGIITGTLQVGATASNKYDKGDKINFTQGGTNMYGYVYSIPSGTTLLITGGTDYQLGTTAVTSLQYSKAQSPNGFPGTFNFNPNETYTGTAPTGNTKRVSQFSMQGNMVYTRFYASYSTAGSSTQLTINQPIPSLESASIYHDYMYGGLGTADNTMFAGIASGAVVMFSNTVIQSGPYGAQANKSAYIQGFYPV